MASPTFPGMTRYSIGAGTLLALVTILLAVTFACVLVGTRADDVGTDTHVYARFFLSLGNGTIETRLEPGFVLISWILRWLGLGVVGYQSALFLCLIVTVVTASKEYFRYLGSGGRYASYLAACIAVLFLSPVFVNASINTIRQGLASLLVFSSILAFHDRRWRMFAVYGACAAAMHYSSLLYMVFAPILLTSQRRLKIVFALAFALYCSGLSEVLVRDFLPSLYEVVMDYSAGANYRSGVRIDFAIFSMFWYVLPYATRPLIDRRIVDRVVQSTSVYLVLLLPFFAVGWGNFSNRYLLPAWLSASLIVAAMAVNCRIRFLRSTVFILSLLLASCGVYAFYVSNIILI